MNLSKMKGTHTVYFNISFYNANQKPVPSRINFHLETDLQAHDTVNQKHLSFVCQQKHMFKNGAPHEL